MTSFFVENLKVYAQLRYFTHMDLEFLWWKGEKCRHFWKTKSGLGLEGTGDYGMMRYITKE